jgi:hypothetical protein
MKAICGMPAADKSSDSHQPSPTKSTNPRRRAARTGSCRCVRRARARSDHHPSSSSTRRGRRRPGRSPATGRPSQQPRRVRRCGR